MHPWANMQPAKVDMVDEEKLTEGKTSFLFIFYLFFVVYTLFTLCYWETSLRMS